uniref:Putative secreted protein n=1 Tax=Amblyomma triste TaxID=251400 RepID=A0A023G3P2_AMBTT
MAVAVRCAEMNSTVLCVYIFFTLIVASVCQPRIQRPGTPPQCTPWDAKDFMRRSPHTGNIHKCLYGQRQGDTCDFRPGCRCGFSIS